MRTIRAFHGGEKEGARWFTTDRDHARQFGPVHEAEILVGPDAVEIDSMEDHLVEYGVIDGRDADTWMGGEIEAALLGWMCEEFVDTAIVRDHPETDGHVIIVAAGDARWLSEEGE